MERVPMLFNISLYSKIFSALKGTCFVNGKIYAFGGWRASGGNAGDPMYKIVEVYDVNTDQWTSISEPGTDKSYNQMKGLFIPKFLL